MRKLFDKNETLISILLIVIYLISNSFCLSNFGIYNYKTFLVNFILTVLIILFIFVCKLGDYFSLTKFPNPKKFLYFIPLILLMSVNIWGGINLDYKLNEILFYMLSMICVGFLEEIIFRGFLFKMISKDDLKLAVIITSFTFGVGHIINLFNGASLIPTLVQICYALATGYMFAIILVKGKSLWPCVITHSIVNSLSLFVVEGVVTTYIGPIVLTVVPILYSIYLNKTIKE